MCKHNLLALLGGAVLGAALAIALTSDKGKMARRKVVHYVHDEKDKIMDIVDHLRKKAEKAADGVRARAEEMKDEIKNEIKSELDAHSHSC